MLSPIKTGIPIAELISLPLNQPHSPSQSPNISPLMLMSNALEGATSYLPLAAVAVLLGIGVYLTAKPEIAELLDEARNKLLGDPVVARDQAIEKTISVLENYFWNAQELSNHYDEEISERENQFIASQIRSETLERSVHNLIAHHVKDLTQRETLTTRQVNQLCLRLRANIREVEFVRDRFTERLKLTMKKNHPPMSMERWIHTRNPLPRLPYVRWYALIEMRALILREIFASRFSSHIDVRKEAIQLYQKIASIFSLNESDTKAGLEDLRRAAINPELQNLAQDTLEKLNA